MRYGGTVGWIRISARALPGGVEVVIANASSAIGMEQRQCFFDRFYRGDAARNRRSEGSGLGLSLAREIARAHGGDLTLQSSRPDEVRLRLWLPRPSRNPIVFLISIPTPHAGQAFLKKHGARPRQAGAVRRIALKGEWQRRNDRNSIGASSQW